MKFWLDWHAHRKALVGFGIFGIAPGFVGLLCVLPPWAVAWIVLTVVVLALYAIIYSAVKDDLDPPDSTGRH